MSTIIPSSKIQEQFWLATKLYPNNIAYNVSIAFALSKTPDLHNLEIALLSIIRNNESLRASFHINEGKLMQSIINEDEIRSALVFELRKEDYSDYASQILKEESTFQFDLSQPSLIRVKLTQFGDEKALLTIIFHHIIIDMTSRDLFCKQLSTYYNALQNRQSIVFEDISPQYNEFIEWENEFLISEKAKRKLDYWHDKFKNPVELLRLPYDRQKTLKTNLSGKSILFNIEEQQVEEIKDFIQKYCVNHFLFLFACYSILLHRLSAQEQITIGVPLTNRCRQSDKLTIGCFINSLPISIDFRNNPSIVEVMEQLRKEFLFAHRNQEIPLLEIINHIEKGTNRGTDPLYQVGFTKEPLADISFSDIESEPLNIEKQGAQLDLFLKIVDSKLGLKLAFEYNSELFDEETIHHWIELYTEIIKSCILTETLPVSQINILSANEIASIENWNATEVAYERNLCVHQKLEQFSNKFPDLPALRFNDSILTYRELNESANRLANYFIAQGIKTEDKIVICVERSMEMMIGIFGILKAGGTYLPIDPKNPQNRLTEIINDAQPKIILTDSKSDLNLPRQVNIIYIDHIHDQPLGSNNSNPDCNVKPQNVAYIIYTSGSTGNPKGVMIEHHSLMNRLDWMQKEFPLSSNDVLLQKTNITFDVSVWELFWWSFAGASLAILSPGAEREPSQIVNEIDFYKVTAIHFVPSMFSVFIDYLKSSHIATKISGLKWIIASGEALHPKTVNEFNKLRTSNVLPEIVNLYGPTEATIDVSCYRCPKHKDITEIPIGRTIDNTGLYIINKAGIIQPWGVPGELVISGVNLAKGYFNNTALTDEKFPTIKILNDKNERIYRTGDLAKWNPDGNIVYLGRIDNQIKIRGFRIELGEIESKLLENPKIKEAAVILQNGSSDNPMLKAFIVVFDNEKIDAIYLKKYLSEKLPSYMMPSQIQILDKMPVSQNGKIDRKALSAIKAFKTDVLMPSTPSAMEQKLIDIYTELFYLTDIKNTDNFFDLGGNSLMAIRLMTSLYEKFEVKLEVVRIFEFPTIKEFANYLSSVLNDTEDNSISTQKSRRELKYSNMGFFKRNKK